MPDRQKLFNLAEIIKARFTHIQCSRCSKLAILRRGTLKNWEIKYNSKIFSKVWAFCPGCIAATLKYSGADYHAKI